MSVATSAHLSVSVCLSVCLSIYHKVPRNKYADSEDRPDIVFFVTWSLHDHDGELDISLSHPRGASIPSDEQGR